MQSYFQIHKNEKINLSFPYKNAGLTKCDTALHLLNRVTYGVKTDQDKILTLNLFSIFKKLLFNLLQRNSGTSKLMV